MTPRFDLAAFLENTVPAWLQRVLVWRPRRRCTSRDLQDPRLRCQRFRGHEGMHHAAIAVWDEPAPSDGTVRVVPGRRQ